MSSPRSVIGRPAHADGYTARVPHTEPFLVPGDDATLASILAAAWSLLERAAGRAPEDWRWPVLASVDSRDPERAAADARVVVLRRADARDWTLEVHGDARSHKLAQLRAAPRACLVFHDRGRELQLRAWADATVHVRDAVARRAWDALHASSRRAYLAPRTPGETTAAPDANQPPGLAGRLPDAAESEPGFTAFAAIVLQVRSLEWLRLDRDGHQRARFDAPDAGGAPSMCWVRP
jgi:pyridoxamine 5'-phosphate oxidase